MSSLAHWSLTLCSLVHWGIGGACIACGPPVLHRDDYLIGPCQVPRDISISFSGLSHFMIYYLLLLPLWLYFNTTSTYSLPTNANLLTQFISLFTFLTTHSDTCLQHPTLHLPDSS